MVKQTKTTSIQQDDEEVSISLSIQEQRTLMQHMKESNLSFEQVMIKALQDYIDSKSIKKVDIK
ncbi:MAG: hypothetical protein U9N42_00860 [Campylobacterota bacterium]|nr:hypothetical protein [Campylobacterota bacterium]